MAMAVWSSMKKTTRSPGKSSATPRIRQENAAGNIWIFGSYLCRDFLNHSIHGGQVHFGQVFLIDRCVLLFEILFYVAGWGLSVQDYRYWQCDFWQIFLSQFDFSIQDWYGVHSPSDGLQSSYGGPWPTRGWKGYFVIDVSLWSSWWSCLVDS